MKLSIVLIKFSIQKRENDEFVRTATHCNTLQHAATRCTMMQHAAAPCNTMQQDQHATVWICTHCNTLQYTATRCDTLQHATIWIGMQGITLQHSAAPAT